MKSLYREYVKQEKAFSEIQEKLKHFRKGNLRKRSIGGKTYYYLQYREDKHIRSIYIHADEVDTITVEISQRKELEKAAKEAEHRLKAYAEILGIHRTYRPVRNVDYAEYTLFMSAVAHDYKNLDHEHFTEKYRTSRYRGINKRYLVGFYDYVNGVERGNTRRTNDLILDPYTYLMYFKYGHKEILAEEIKRAIPAFLNQGLLITNIQEAVNGAYSK
jgi:hypothetical protein